MWLHLSDIDGKIVSNISQIDDDNFVLIKQQTNTELVTISNYNITNNKWNKLIKLVQDTKNDENETIKFQICYNKKVKSLFIFNHDDDYENVLTIYDYKSHQFETINMKRKIGKKSCMVEVNGQIHLIISQNVSKYHLKWNNNTKQFDEIYKWNDTTNNKFCGKLLYLKSKKKLLLLPECDIYTESDCIWTHSLGSNSWNKIDVKCPDYISKFECITTSKDKYIFTFGGIYCGPLFRSSSISSIWILDTDKMKWYGQIIEEDDDEGDDEWLTFEPEEDEWLTFEPEEDDDNRQYCPNYDTFCGILMSYRYNNELLINGFLKSGYVVCDNDSDWCIPQDIMGLICNWYGGGFVHLMNRSGNNHWKISIDDLLVNMET